jgi:DNA-binding HxlR family transcriptional regulator
MPITDEFIEFLDTRRSVLKVMLTIYDLRAEGEDVTSAEIWRRIGGGNKTIVDRVKELEEYRFIERREQRTYPYAKHITLTDRGERFARILDDLREIELHGG